MGTCILCGKKGIFLKLDVQGRCSECAEKIEKEEAKAFGIYYSNLLLNLKSLQEAVNVGDNPIKALELIPRFKEKVEICEKLQLEIHNTKYAERLANKLISCISYRSDFNKRHGIGELEEWDITVFAHSTSNEFSGDKIIEQIDKRLLSYKSKWKKTIKSIIDSADFQKEIDAIPSVNVEITNTKHSKQTVSELQELIKYTNITPKTSFDRIGSFVVIDTETTGLSSTKDSLVEVAAIKFEDWTPIEKFHTLINPGKHIPDEASVINKITDEMVVDSPTFSQIIDSLDAFVGKSSLVGHNLPFDLKFLYRHGYNFANQKRRYYDTCEIAQKILKKPKMKWDKECADYIINDNYDYDVENYKLTTLCDYYEIRDNLFAHRALSDALATGILFKKLAQDKIDY